MMAHKAQERAYVRRIIRDGVITALLCLAHRSGDPGGGRSPGPGRLRGLGFRHDPVRSAPAPDPGMVSREPRHRPGDGRALHRRGPEPDDDGRPGHSPVRLQALRAPALGHDRGRWPDRARRDPDQPVPAMTARDEAVAAMAEAVRTESESGRWDGYTVERLRLRPRDVRGAAARRHPRQPRVPRRPAGGACVPETVPRGRVPPDPPPTTPRPGPMSKPSRDAVAVCWHGAGTCGRASAGPRGSSQAPTTRTVWIIPRSDELIRLSAAAHPATGRVWFGHTPRRRRRDGAGAVRHRRLLP